MSTAFPIAVTPVRVASGIDFSLTLAPKTQTRQTSRRKNRKNAGFSMDEVAFTEQAQVRLIDHGKHEPGVAKYLRRRQGLLLDVYC